MIWFAHVCFAAVFGLYWDPDACHRIVRRGMVRGWGVAGRKGADGWVGYAFGLPDGCETAVWTVVSAWSDGWNTVKSAAGRQGADG